ncbi:MAG TPA: DUF5908 family protein [Hymenobacter sp.]|jgi:hypothetical protein|uniref:DUF5908 family protein n=1 Tax=Hymenobacter sp. TaxID=1898978 RepID=UPI002ED8062A
MAIEIRELIIQVTLHETSPGGGPAAAAPLNGAAIRQLQQDLTQECVRQVLTELQRQRER